MHKFVVRLLDASDVLLAWATVMAEPKPQGRNRSCPFYATGPTQFVITTPGIAEKVTIHWCELDIARIGGAIEPTPVEVGQVFTWTWLEPVWLVAGMKDVPLPPVTVYAPVTIAPPTGSLMAVSE